VTNEATSAGIAIVGCGYVADSYRRCLRLHDGELRLVGVYDRDPERLAAFAACWGDRTYAALADVLSDPDVRIVVNLTTPENHADVTAAAIAAGKHVYSEKPLGMTVGEAESMRDQARAAGVRLAAAPCSMLGESAQTLWAAVRRGAVGRVALAYAELDDGMVHRANYRDWKSRSGRVWPARGEFETGCTFEHAGYAITLFAAMFGPVRRVTSFSALLIPDKRTDPPLPHPAPDFSVGCLEFDDGVVARITNSVVAPYDHRMRVIGEDGVLELREPWDYASPVRLRRASQSRLARLMERKFGSLGASRVPPARKTPFRGGRGEPTMDFMRGVAELAGSIRSGRPCRLDEDFAVHVTEVTEMLQHPDRFDRPAVVRSSFAPIAPMDWAS
jgi:predicted dehydrogenase